MGAVEVVPLEDDVGGHDDRGRQQEQREAAPLGLDGEVARDDPHKVHRYGQRHEDLARVRGRVGLGLRGRVGLGLGVRVEVRVEVRVGVGVRVRVGVRVGVWP